ncbi:MAG: TonB-dependent receptor, partial [Planctomycetales bacterium]
NLQWINHFWESSHIGTRGIISDREEKYLLLVNGRVMNERTHIGAITERDLVYLKDIHHIDVVRGPGSFIYGPGSVSMVISITTHDAKTFEGTEVNARGGVIEEFTSVEVKHARKWKNAEGGLFLFGGVGSYHGADQGQSPLVNGASDAGYPGFGSNLNALGSNYIAGQDASWDNPHDRESFRGQEPLKFHAQVDYNEWTAWFRYTRSGNQTPFPFSSVTNVPAGFGNHVATDFQHEFGQQQVTLFAKHDHEVTDDLRWRTSVSFDSLDYVRQVFFGLLNSHREDEFTARTVLSWSGLENHEVAIGGEFFSNWFGGAPNFVDAPPVNVRLGNNFVPWDAQMYSLFAEDQWRATDDFTVFLGGRLDKHIYTPWMFSPRASFVYEASEVATWKFIMSRSVRTNFDEELRAEFLATGNPSDPEVSKNLELRYEEELSEELFWAVSTYYTDLDVIGFANGQTAPIANQVQWGMEGELRYQCGDGLLLASHGYTKLLDFTLADPTMPSFISASGEGFGGDLAQWSNHVTKIAARRPLTDAWSMDGSLRYLWGFPGQRDLA